MKGIKGTGKRLCCWLLTGILLTGQNSSLAYAEEANVQDDSTEAFDLEETGEQTEESILSTEMENDVPQEEVDLQEDDILQEADAPQEENVRASDVLRPGSIGGEKLPVGTVFDEGGLRWRVSAGSNTGEAIDCLGPAEGTTVSGTLEIPFMVTHEDYVYWVPSIEPGAFANCTELTELVMVSTSGSFSVGDQQMSSTGAFEGCTNLRKVTIGVTCHIIGNNTFKGCTSLETFEAAPYEDDGIRRSFEGIRSSAFEGCTSLREVSLGGCKYLRWISSSTFKGCTNLEKVTLPEGMTSIERNGFEDCSSLEEIILPASLQTIGSSAFKNCVKLKSIKMPAGTELLQGWAFEGCSSLVEVEMPDKIVIVGSKYLGENIFSGCTLLKTLKIDTTAPQGGASYVTPEVKNNSDKVFDTLGTLPADRKVVFLNSDGTAALSGSDLMAAQAAYRAVNDGNTADDYWYGWEIGTVDMYPVEITVKKDDAVWADSGKNFQLSSNGVDFISYDPENTYVLEGTYRVYEVTESGRTDTQVHVTVDEDHAAGAAEVNYYTVTFYQDLEHKVPYGIGTDQKPQIVLSGARAVKPADPAAAEGCQFGGWLKEVNTTREFQLFDFTPAIDRTTDLYANWTSLYYTIEVSAGDGGSITPRSNVNVRHGADQSFVITPDRDHHIKEIIIDGTAIADADLAEKASYTYTFSDVTEGHKITVTFEENPAVTEPEDPNKPVTPDTPDTPGTPDQSGTSDTPQTPSTPGTTDTPNTPDVPGTSDTSQTPSTPGATDTPNTPDSGNVPENPGVTVPDQTAAANPPADSGNSAAGSSEGSGQNREPRTGDTTPVEMYATLAMIAGLTEVMLYFARNRKGMTEAKKKELVSLLVSWAKGRGRLRRYVALVAIFGLLLYYHSIGKRMSGEWNTLLQA